MENQKIIHLGISSFNTKGRGLQSNQNSILNSFSYLKRKGLQKQGTKAFTLVELIVVITILAILSTIGFVAYSGYLMGTRDTNRIAQLKSISEGLEMYRTKHTLPTPDDYVEVKSNGKLIAYQGYVGQNVLETITYSTEGVDPKDGTYYSYYLTNDKKKYQLMAFLEEEEKNATAYDNKPGYPQGISLQKNNVGEPFMGSLIMETAQAIDYSTRYPSVFGKKLGILTDEDNTPIQEIEDIKTNGLDVKTATGYLAYVGDGKVLKGKEIAGLESIAKLGGMERNLVAWYDFETIDGTGLLDLSGHHYDGNIIGNFSKIHTGAIGPVGKAMKFDGDNTSDYIILPNEVLDGKKDYSVSLWMKFYNYTNDCLSGLSVVNNNGSSNGKNNELLFEGSKDNEGLCVEGHSLFRSCSNNKYNIDKWYNLFLSKIGPNFTVYLDGKLVSNTNSGYLNGYQINAKGIVLGQEQDDVLGGFDANQAMKGELDDLRIYEGTITEDRIKKIYNLGRR